MRSLLRLRPGAATGAALLMMLIGACSGSGGPSGTTAPPKTATSSVTGTPTQVAHLTNGDNGSTTRVPVGAAVDVTLTPDAGYHYSQPASSDQTVLRAATSSESLGTVIGEFRAVQAGTAVVTAAEDPNCLPRCGLPSRLWEATVVVSSDRVP